MPQASFKVLTDRQEVQPYVKTVSDQADTHKNELGFIPRSAYQEQSHKGRLWVAVSTDNQEYAGHLMFGGQQPSVKVFQVFVNDQFRGRGVGRLLIDELVSFAKANGFLSITARVAEDLDVSNDFWASLGFKATTLLPGGKSKKRRIILRALTLDTPSLFSALETKERREFGSLVSLPNGPLKQERGYALDLCIILDVVRNRTYQNQASELIGLSLAGHFDLFVTSEFADELRRNKGERKDDPLFELALRLPTLPPLDWKTISTETDQLKAIIFSPDSTGRKPKVQDESDVRHIASAIHHGLDGFITREKRILRSAAVIKNRYGLDVLSPQDFGYGDTDRNTIEVDTLIFGKESFVVGRFIESDRHQVTELLEQLGVSHAVAKSALKPGPTSQARSRYVLKESEKIIGFASWTTPSPVDEEVQCFLFVDESVPRSQTFIEHILESFSRDVAYERGRKFCLYISLAQTMSQQVAVQSGYQQTGEPQEEEPTLCLMKFAISGLVYPGNWESFVTTVENLARIQLPKRMPTYRSVKRDGLEVVRIGQRKVEYIDLFGLETYLKPVHVLFPGREGVLVPIIRSFAEDLLGSISDQDRLFGVFDAKMKLEKAFFRNPRLAGDVHRGDTVVFYASGTGGGPKKAVGCGRVTFSEVMKVDEVDLKTRNSGVLSRELLQLRADKQNRVHVFTFDGFQPFVQEVGIDDLRKIGAGRKNFITIERLGQAAFKKLMLRGFGYED
jgi:GNAT superfamily N-acetyltransferase